MTEATSADISTALFAMLEGLPLGGVLTGIATLLIASFFITSADSATYVLGLQSSGGRKEPSNPVKLTWGVMQSLIAVALLLSGGLAGLQSASVVAALPFSVIMIGMCVSLLKGLRSEFPASTPVKPQGLVPARPPSDGPQPQP